MRTTCFLFLFLISASFAEEVDILPSEFPVTRYSEIWENSPFNREVVAQIEVRNQSAFAANLVLEGLVTDESAGFIAYLRDLKENTFLVVTKDKSGASPLYLVDATKTNNPSDTLVTISDGTETAEIRYADGVFTQKINAPAPAPAAANGKRNAQAVAPATAPANTASSETGNAGPPGVTSSAPPGVTNTNPLDTNTPPAQGGPPEGGGPPIDSSSRNRGIITPSNPPVPPR